MARLMQANAAHERVFPVHSTDAIDSAKDAAAREWPVIQAAHFVGALECRIFSGVAP